MGKLGKLLLAVAVLSLVPVRPAGALEECGPGHARVADIQQNVVTPEASDWYDASARQSRGYSLRAISPTSVGILIFQWDGDSQCLAAGGAFSEVVQADFTLRPGRWLIEVFANGATPAGYVLVSN